MRCWRRGRAEAGGDPVDLPAEAVPPWTSSGGVLERLVALSSGGMQVWWCRGPVARQEDRVQAFIGQGHTESWS